MNTPKAKIGKTSILLGLIIVGLMFSFLLVLPPVHALTPTVNPPVKVASNQNAVAITNGATYGAVPMTNAACFTNGQWFVVYSIAGGQTLWYSWSSDGLTWSTAQLLYTTVNAVSYWTIVCFSTFIELVYASTVSPYQFLDSINVANPTTPSSGGETGVSGSPASTSGNPVGASLDSSLNTITSQQQNGVANLYVYKNGVYQTPTIAITSGLSSDEPLGSTTALAFYSNGGGTCGSQCPTIRYGGTTYTLSAGASTYSGMGQPAYGFFSGSQKIIFPYSTSGGQTGQQCAISSFDTFLRTFSTVTPAGALTGCQVNPTNNWAVGEVSQTYVWLVFGGTASQLYASSDGGNTYTLIPMTLKAGATTLQPYALGGIASNGGNLQAMLVLTDQAGSLYTVLIGQAAQATTVTQTIGSCPNKNTATFTMVNSTIYLYYGNALGNEVVNSVQTAVASVGGSTGTHTIQLLIYAANSNTANAGTPLNLVLARSISLTSGTTKSVITAQVNLALPSNGFFGTGNLWGVGIVGDNKIALNQSSLSGLFTLAGNPSTQAQPSTFTTQGTSVGTQIYLCAVASYQSVITTTSTATSLTTTTLSQGTVTTNANAPNQSGFWFLPLLYLLFPFSIAIAVYGGIRWAGGR